MSIISPDKTGAGLAGRRAPSAYRQPSTVDGAESLAAEVGSALERRWSAERTLLGEMCHYALVPTGKLFRPTLLLESALAVGGEVSAVLPAAVGAECGHVASLIHDDIIDADDLRRGRPSVQHKFGIGDAIVAGDALIFDLFAGLADCRVTGVPDDRVVSALDAVARAGLDLCRGQSLESELSRELRFDAEGYLTVARLKTAAYFRGACQSGALLGGGTEAMVAALGSYGDNLGLAFQIHDDLLAYVSTSENTGKPGTSDIQNARMTLPVILAHDAGDDADRAALRAAMSGGDIGQALDFVRNLLDRTNALTAAAHVAREYAEKSRAALAALPESASRDRLGWIADLVIARDH
ncbi:polyprenyl synthetase family protein [Actinokineospora sp.]|uniref:polyprenyl synthetase family protein n=1 Tax=Actinokineospora sp. TaxID=1872133 RepID=UPI004037B169